MIEKNQLRHPKVENSINVANFLKAVTNKEFTSYPFFFKKLGKSLKNDDRFVNLFDRIEDDLEYLVAVDSKIHYNKNLNPIVIEVVADENPNIGFLFLRCIIPPIIINNANTADWLFSNSFSEGDISISKNSTVGNLIFRDNSKVKSIQISEASKCGTITVQDHCHVTSINLSQSASSAMTILLSSTVENISLQDFSENGHIQIMDNSTNEKIFVNESSINSNIVIQDNSSINSLVIAGNSAVENISVEENSKCSSIQILGGSRSKELRFQSYCEINEVLLSLDGQVGDISVNGNAKVGDFTIECACRFGNLDIQNSKISKLEINGGQFSLKLSTSELSQIILNGCHIHILQWQGRSQGELYMQGGFINYLQLEKTSIPKDSTIAISNAKIFIASLQEVQVQGQLILRNIIPSRQTFNWDNETRVPLKNDISHNSPKKTDTQIKLAKLVDFSAQQKRYSKDAQNLLEGFAGSRTPLLRIVDSSIGKSEITGSDFQDVFIEFRNSKVVDSFITGTEFPVDDSIVIYIHPGEQCRQEIEYEQKISFYNQLKKIGDQKGDILAAGYWHSRALFYQQKHLWLTFRTRTLRNRRLREKRLWFWKRYVRIEFLFEYFGFVINKWTNNHGISWFRALIFTVILSLATYTCYYYSLNHNKEFDWSGTGHYLGNYFSYFNVAHRLDFMVKADELTNYSKFFDFLGRVVIAYCLYQFIAAYRRHGRSSG